MIVFLGLALLAMGASEPQRRIKGNLDNSETFTVTGNTRPMLARAQDQGEVDAALPLTRMTVHFTLSAAQSADQQQLLKQQATRKTSQYHKWLTPEEYGARFGVNSADLEQMTAWLAQQGFSNIEVGRSHTSISFSGNAAQVQNAFHTSIHHYVTSDGKTHFANSSDPALPKALAGMVASIRGLNDLHPAPHARPHFTSSISGNHFLTPDDFATIYDLQPLYGNGIDGTGQKIAVVGQTDIALSDIEAFRTAAGLPPNDPQILLTGTDPGTIADDEGESDLDIEWAGGVAKGATILFVTSTDVFTSLTYAIENNVAPVISITYGNCEASLGSAETTALNTLLIQATMQGQTVAAASGDSGAADCDTKNTASSGLAVDFPASSPYATGLGGTAFNEGAGSYWNTTNNTYGGSAIAYIPEIAWNDTSLGQGLAASGGGASIFFTKPTWQVGASVPNDGARDVPDLALDSSPSHDGLLYCTGGSCVSGFRDANQNLTVVGGTSASSPTFAAIVALLNQQTKSVQGNMNPTLYTLASFSTDAFHDITSGNNIVPCRTGTPNCPASPATLQFGYSAGTGYDQVTGLGSVDAYNLIREWTGDFSVSANPATLSIARGASASASVAVASEGNFAGTVSFTCTVSTSLTNTSCSIPGTISGSGTATLTVTTGATAGAPGWRQFGKFPWQMIALGWLLVLSSFFYMRQSGRLRTSPTLCAFAFVLVLTGCGDGNGGTSSNISPVVPPVTTETGTVTINATSGTLTNSATISVSVP
ncbi:MAG TPA: S53 family serine peptidase [Bryobacteraceae bacterium]